MCTNKKHLYPHTVCVCKRKNIYLLTHCDVWVSQMCAAHIKIFLSSQRVCLCFTDMFEQKTFKPSQAKCIRVCFSDIYRCLQVFRDVYKKKNIYILLALWPRWVALPYHRSEARNWTLLCNEKHCGWHLSCCTTHDPQQDTNNCRFCKDFSNAQMMLIISCQIVQDATYLRWHLFWSASYLHKLQKDEVCLSVSYVLSSLSRGVPSELIAGDVKQIVEKTHKCTRHPNCIKTIDCRPRPSDDVDDDDD